MLRKGIAAIWFPPDRDGPAGPTRTPPGIQKGSAHAYSEDAARRHGRDHPGRRTRLPRPGAGRSRYTVVDDPPDGLFATSAEGRHWSCRTGDAHRVVTCSSDDRLEPRDSSEPITIRTRLTDTDKCLLVNIAAVTGGDRRRDDDNLLEDPGQARDRDQENAVHLAGSKSRSQAHSRSGMHGHDRDHHHSW
jgi:hypothetical protein